MREIPKETLTERTTVRTSRLTRPTMLLFLVATLLALVAATLPLAPTAALAQEEGALGFELTFAPGDGDSASVVQARVFYLATGNPAVGLFADIQAYPYDDGFRDVEGDDLRRVVVSGELSEDGTLELQVPAANLEGVDELEVGLDVFEEWDRMVQFGSYYRIFTVGEPGQFSTPRLSDVVGSTHERNIFELISIGITAGFPDGTYRPEASVQRGQLATFLSRSVWLEPEPDIEVALNDIAGTTHELGILMVVEAGVVSGYEDGTYRPEEDVTRAQMATFIARALDLPEAPASEVTDIDGNVHQDAIDRVIDAGIAGGYADGTYRPGEVVTRSQMATFLIRAREWLFDQWQ